MFLTSSSLKAQDDFSDSFQENSGKIKISGTVTNDSGDPLSGVNVIIEGTDLGAATDEDGSYSIEDVDMGSILKASSIGYESSEKTADSSMVNFVLTAKVIEMTELEVLASEHQNLLLLLTLMCLRKKWNSVWVLRMYH